MIPAVNRRLETQHVWQAELQRWLATQLSARHPNHEHVALLWNVQSQQCQSLADAFREAETLAKRPMSLVNARAECVFLFYWGKNNRQTQHCRRIRGDSRARPRRDPRGEPLDGAGELEPRETPAGVRDVRELPAGEGPDSPRGAGVSRSGVDLGTATHRARRENVRDGVGF